MDAYDAYGMSLEPGAIDAVMTPAPNKEPVSASSATAHGRALLGGTIGLTDARMLSFDVHFRAATKAQYLTRYYNFRQQILESGYVQLRVILSDGSPFPLCNGAAGAMHLVYQDCKPFRQFRMGMAKFTLFFSEPHPEITDNREPSIMQ